MLQIVIYKKLNFWEKYTPLSMGPLFSRVESSCDKIITVAHLSAYPRNDRVWEVFLTLTFLRSFDKKAMGPVTTFSFN